MTVTQMPFLAHVPGVDPELEPSTGGPAGAAFAVQIDVTGLPTDQQLRIQALAWALQLEGARAPYPDAGLQPGFAVVADAARYAAYLTTGTVPPD